IRVDPPRRAPRRRSCRPRHPDQSHRPATMAVRTSSRLAFRGNPMSVRREKRRDGRTAAVREFWFVDFVFEHPDGRHERVRKVSPVQTRRGAEQYERELRQALLDGSRKERKEAPRFAEFAQEFLDVYAATNNKASTLSAKKSAFKHHLLPAFGRMRLDEI